MTAGYGRIAALHDVTLEVRPGELVCLIGANGAGKSTTLKAISGLVRPTAGRITWDGQESSASRLTRSSAAASRTAPRGGACSPT